VGEKAPCTKTSINAPKEAKSDPQALASFPPFSIRILTKPSPLFTICILTPPPTSCQHYFPTSAHSSTAELPRDHQETSTHAPPT
jgi:hypothetical protein